MNKRKVDAALEWAARGFHVFPLGVKSTKPVVEDWPNVATVDPEKIATLWNGHEYNVGVHCADLIVVDIDVKNGKQGALAFMDLGYDADTLTVRTPSGGSHLYYRGPNVSNSASKLGDGLDVRSWHGYVIAPGSETSVGAYALVNDVPLIEAPPDLVARAGAPRERQEVSQQAVTSDQGAAMLRAISWLRDEAPLAIEGQGGDDVTYKVAARLKDFGLLYQGALAAMGEHWNARCMPPWDYTDLKTKVMNAYAYGTKAPGADDAAAHFNGVSIPEVEKPTMRWIEHGEPLMPVRWLFHDTLPAVGLAILTAPSQAGKTFLALDLARSLATGETWFTVAPDDHGATIFLAAEGSGSISRRMAALSSGGRAPARLPIVAGMVDYLGQRTALAALRDDLKNKSRTLLEQHGMPVRLVVLDTLSASGLLDDENDNAKASAALKILAGIAYRMECLFLITHHPPKEGKGVGGAGALANRADYVMEVTRAFGGVRELFLTKSRDSEARTIGSFTLNTVQVGMDEKGRPITSCIIEHGMPLRHNERTPDHYDKFMSALSLSFSDGTPEVTNETLMGYFIEAAGANRAGAYKKCKIHALSEGMLIEVARDGVSWLTSVAA